METSESKVVHTVMHAWKQECPQDRAQQAALLVD